MKELRQANVLLTGAAGGIGRHIARALAAEGANLALSGRNVEALEELAGETRTLGATVAVVPADLAEAEAARSLPARAEQELGPLDVVVNNAGIELASSFTRLDPRELEQLTAVNLLAPLLITHAVVPGMLERGRGHVVQLSSLAGKSGPPYSAPYAAAKAGLVALTESLRAEYADAPVGFSVVCPGYVAGDGMYARAKERGVRGSRAMGETSTEACARAVVKAIRKDAPELIVNPVPVRPLLALSQLSPRLGETAKLRARVGDPLRQMAERTGRT